MDEDYYEYNTTEKDPLYNNFDKGPLINRIMKNVALITTLINHEEKLKGTGFFVGYKNYILLVTCYHLVENCDEFNFSYLENSITSDSTLEFDRIKKLKRKSENFVISDCHKNNWDKDLDIAIFILNNQDNDILRKDDIEQLIYLKFSNFYWHKYEPNYKPLFDIENVLIIGHPNGKLDPSGLFPISRKGSTSSPINANSDHFLIDFSVYGGFSGSPVFYYEKNYSSLSFTNYTERFYFLGMLKSSSEISTKLGSNKSNEKLIEKNKLTYSDETTHNLLDLISKLKIKKSLDISEVLKCNKIYEFIIKKIR